MQISVICNDSLKRQWHFVTAAFFMAVLTAWFLCVPQASAYELTTTGVGTIQRRIVINIPTRNLIVYDGERELQRFQVGVGRPAFPTPIGAFSVINLIVNPSWENPYLGTGAMRITAGSNNPLGTRWIGFKAYQGGEYGIHGTDRPSSVGQYSSHGCVRMRVKEAEALYALVDYGTPVDVTYETVVIQAKEINGLHQVTVQVYPDKYGRGYPSVEAVRSRILSRYPQAVIDSAKLAAALKIPNGLAVSVAAIQAQPHFSTNTITPQVPLLPSPAQEFSQPYKIVRPGSVRFDFAQPN